MKVITGLSYRADGSMVWWNQLPVDPMIQVNRDRYFIKQGIEPRRVVAGGMAHQTQVVAVGEDQAGHYLVDTDGLVTDVANLFLSITVADCLPVFFYDPARHAIGIAHAGWRGLVGGILENTVAMLQSTYGTSPADLIISTGPAIGVCHYEVGPEVAARFAPENIEQRNGHLFAKLVDEAVARLRAVGVNNSTVDPTCTYCSADRLYSARHDKTEPLEGMVAYIGLSA